MPTWQSERVKPEHDAFLQELRGVAPADRRFSPLLATHRAQHRQNSARSLRLDSQALKSSAPSALPKMLGSPGWSILTIAVLIFALTVSVTLLCIQSSSLTRLQAAQAHNNNSALSSSSSPSSSSSRSQSHQEPSNGLSQESSTPQEDPRSNISAQQSQQFQTQKPSELQSTSPQESQPAPAPSNNDSRINVNTANLEQLQEIPGVGPVNAQKILDYRSRHGSFTQVDDLMEVSGIGAKTLEKMRDHVRVQ
ncbi:ComEA family DNA-binding protein [Alloscardovia omnicolens]|uniref:ComEA family DNA-binding protein n=1 Tax=Alloscardovia omnicolens TaxID=419015 RepID=UPI003A6C96C4